MTRRPKILSFIALFTLASGIVTVLISIAGLEQGIDWDVFLAVFIGSAWVIIGAGLWKMKKWAYYGFLLTVGYGFVTFLQDALFPKDWSAENFSLGVAQRLNLTLLLGNFIGVLLELIMAFYLYTQRKLFR